MLLSLPKIVWKIKSFKMLSTLKGNILKFCLSNIFDNMESIYNTLINTWVVISVKSLDN